MPKRTSEHGNVYSRTAVNRAGKLMLELRERIKTEGEEKAVQALGGEARLDDAWDALTWWRGLHARPLTTVAANLRYHVDQEGGRVNGRIEVTQRLKRHITLIDKLARQPGNVTQMHDIGGVRALLPTQGHVYSVSRRLRKTWTIAKVRDYIAEPKRDGYRALHLIVMRAGYPIEVQLRTITQDTWANIVEERTRETGIGLKFGAAGADETAIFAGIADLLAKLDRDELDPDELRQALRSLSQWSDEARDATEEST